MSQQSGSQCRISAGSPASGPRLHRDGLGPLVQVVVQRKGDLVSAGTLAVVDDGRLAFLGQERRAAEHSVARLGRREYGRMPLPMDHVRARHMSERVPVGLVDVVQVIAALVEDGTVRIGRDGAAGARMRQMVCQPRLRWVLRHGRCLLSKYGASSNGHRQCQCCDKFVSHVVVLQFCVTESGSVLKASVTRLMSRPLRILDPAVNLTSQRQYNDLFSRI